ncbi:serine hydroxymethyltransferase [Candidatus Cyanaurora vandensis]|uniref:serine hydroxymethyltransferase n=1 Tax=Candidatus Cyanaurora vandensis TaxID=2714958 RepID=UPI0037BE3027
MAARAGDLTQADPEVARVIRAETERLEYGLGMIPSENLVYDAVLEAQGSIMTNKYAEGYPETGVATAAGLKPVRGRYYGGCEHVDTVENLARNRARELFGVDESYHINVQPYSGSTANMAVYFTLTFSDGLERKLALGDTILGMDLASGGHLTHGSPVNFSSKLYRFIPYQVDAVTERIDFDQLRDLALRYRPRMIVAGATAYPRLWEFDKFKAIADEVGAYLLADICHISGLIAAGAHPSPFPHADFVMTTTHKTLRGPRGAMIFCRAEFGNFLDKTVMPGIQGGPLMNEIAAKAVAFRLAMTESFRQDQHQTVKNAQALADALLNLGYPLVSGGTDNHLLILKLTDWIQERTGDVQDKALGGKQMEQALGAAGITCNRNMVPNDPRKPLNPSGIRLGTPGLTTRGMKEPQMRQVAGFIDRVLQGMRLDPTTGWTADPEVVRQVASEIRWLCEGFPMYRHHLT